MMNFLIKASETYKSEIDKCLSNLDMNSILKSAELLADTHGNIISSGVGKSGFIAEKFSSTLRSFGFKSFFVDPTGASHGDLGVIDSDSTLIVISKSGETQELRDLVFTAKSRNSKIISITNKDGNFLTRMGDINIFMNVELEICPEGLAPTVSTTTSLIICDLIAVSAARLVGFTKSKFRENHPGGSLGEQLKKISDVYVRFEESGIFNTDITLGKAIVKVTGKNIDFIPIKEVNFIYALDLRDLNLEDPSILSLPLKHFRKLFVHGFKGSLSEDEFLEDARKKYGSGVFLVVNSEGDPVGAVRI